MEGWPKDIPVKRGHHHVASLQVSSQESSAQLGSIDEKAGLESVSWWVRPGTAPHQHRVGMPMLEIQEGGRMGSRGAEGSEPGQAGEER